MSDMREHADFYSEAAALEERLAAAKAARAEAKATGGDWDRDELEAAAAAIAEFRSHWRRVGAWVRACNAADDEAAVVVTPGAVSSTGTVGTIGGDSQ